MPFLSLQHVLLLSKQSILMKTNKLSNTTKFHKVSHKFNKTTHAIGDEGTNHDGREALAEWAHTLALHLPENAQHAVRVLALGCCNVRWHINITSKRVTYVIDTDNGMQVSSLTKLTWLAERHYKIWSNCMRLHICRNKASEEMSSFLNNVIVKSSFQNSSHNTYETYWNLLMWSEVIVQPMTQFTAQ